MIDRKCSRPRSGRISLRMETLENRRMLAAYPAYVDEAFTFGDPTAAAPYGLENTFLLESVPGAEKTIYLDFDGHHSVSNSWGHNITFPAYNTTGSASDFADSELIAIQKQWQNVAEDFLPFNINVTTIDPGVNALRRSGGADTEFGVRAVATQATNGFGNGIGGVALLNSFNDSVDNPVFAFNKGARNGGMTISHEVGHALGLSHDGLFSQSYHPGTGSGPTGWGPLMGAPFNKVLTHWSKGEYAGATTTQNDLSIISKPANGFSYRTDDFGNSTATAHELTASAGALLDWGIVERNTDADYFEFSTEAGSVSLSITTFAQDVNLDVLAKLYDSNGSVIAESNPNAGRNASFNETLDAGIYFISVEGTGRPDRYTEYGSLGYYEVSGTIVDSGVIDGDFNDDGLWNEMDVDALVADIAGIGTPAEYDLTGDGAVDLADRDAWLAEAGSINLVSGNPYLLGDLNLSGAVDGADFIGWNANKFTSNAAWSAGDFNADGVVDGLDFTIWNANKFTSSDTPATGDPSTIAGEASFEDFPFWPLQNDVHEREGDGHERDEFLTDVAAEDVVVVSPESIVSGSDGSGTVRRQDSPVDTPTAGFASTPLHQRSGSSFQTFATTRTVGRPSGRLIDLDEAFRLF
jgi:hypothetical protein